MNNIIIATAGSGKTMNIVREALEAHTADNVLIVTYTIENTKELRNRITKKCGCIPPNIRVKTWFSFLLTECVRPYQNFLYDDMRIKNILFTSRQSAPYIRKSDVKNHYLYKGKFIYSDKVSKFAFDCNYNSGGLVIKRLESIYKSIYIDEVQDLAGYDLEILTLLFNTSIDINLVGDTRQVTYLTHQPQKNIQYRNHKIVDFFKQLEQVGNCTIEYKTDCYRCNQSICDLADSLYPDMPSSTSHNLGSTDHDGIYIVDPNDVENYTKIYSPTVLRYSRRSNTNGLNAYNFGLVKGQNHDRVLIFPTAAIKDFLKRGDGTPLADVTRSKLYVAITRAKYSVAFVYSGPVANANFIKYKVPVSSVIETKKASLKRQESQKILGAFKGYDVIIYKHENRFYLKYSGPPGRAASIPRNLDPDNLTFEQGLSLLNFTDF